ncbi:hypothetical protein SAMN04489751_1419 [Brevibacterium sandarakinum]|uniref:Uncharacterized protein n=1 Tax=Brevibacterium sandarakinum TaxID=629680 RepID=A0A1H1Q495_BRESA|nr:hypothetical protein SAMN04489751_1419 [Brevibacterium sandarakinum]
MTMLRTTVDAVRQSPTAACAALPAPMRRVGCIRASLPSYADVMSARMRLQVARSVGPAPRRDQLQGPVAFFPPRPEARSDGPTSTAAAQAAHPKRGAAPMPQFSW